MEPFIDSFVWVDKNILIACVVSSSAEQHRDLVTIYTQCFCYQLSAFISLNLDKMYTFVGRTTNIKQMLWQ